MWFKSSFVFMIYYSAIVMVGINDLSTTAVLFFYRLHYTVRLNLLLEYIPATTWELNASTCCFELPSNLR